MFTEFMEQRAPGHTVLGGNIYKKGMLDFKKEIAESLSKLDYLNDPEATDKAEELKGMDISCDAAIIFAKRHTNLAEEMAEKETDPQRKAELERIAAICRWVPAHAPRDFWEAIQMYWFVHLGTITELNGWDAMNPGHMDQHLYPFYKKGLENGTLDRDKAKELIKCFWVKVNNQPAPPKVALPRRRAALTTTLPTLTLVV
jgi:formate C-acetyltransferase